MPNQLCFCLLAVFLSATTTLAQFEGVVAMNLNWVSKDGTERGGGTLNIAIAKAGMRGEVNLQLGGGERMKSVVLCKADTPNLNYLITDADKTYVEVNLGQPSDAPGPGQAQPGWTVEKLGQEKLLGYKTQHVLAKKTGTGRSMELWMATDFLDFETYRKLQACSGGGDDGGLAQALKAAGAEGMPLRVLITTEAGGRVRMEVVKAQKKSLPASTFEIPAGYTRSVGRSR